MVSDLLPVEIKMRLKYEAFGRYSDQLCKLESTDKRCHKYYSFKFQQEFTVSCAIYL